MTFHFSTEMRNYMDENHLNKIGNTTTAVTDATWVFNGKSKLWVPKHKKPRWLWSGFKDKTTWDWLQLFIQLLTALALPVALFLAAHWFSVQQSQTSELASERQHQTDLQIAADQQREARLQVYFDRMSDLLLNKNLGSSKNGSQVGNIARSLTLTTLQDLDPDRKGMLLRFLYESGLINRIDPLVSLNGANLSGIRIQEMFTSKYVINIIEVDLSNSDLSNADLNHANLPNISLVHSNLEFTDLDGANLSRVSLVNANLIFAILGDAQLDNASLGNASLAGAFLNNANLYYADLAGADLSDAHLNGANLSHANLKGAKVTSEQLAQAKSLKGATMPDGSIHP